MRRTILCLALLALVVSLSAGCRRSIPLANGGNLLTLTNLRTRGTELTSINEWRGRTIIPACTPVRVTAARGRQIIFEAAGTRYRYVIHRTSRVPVQQHLERYFGTECPKLDQMSAVDRQGVQTGLPAIGMTRMGVVAALGYPPDHTTPDINGPQWRFWGDPGAVIVHFQGDTVSHIDGLGPNVAAPAAQQLPAGTATTTTGGQQPATNTAPPPDQGGGGGIDVVEHGEGGHEVVEQ